ncbi:hypothetical protein LEP1GSC040_2665 [Leptospira santarosai str. 2000030832]|nr:hypothetical protein LEP1GSC040_2665 [Leptospira santarosai str. 2000030832]
MRYLSKFEFQNERFESNDSESLQNSKQRKDRGGFGTGSKFNDIDKKNRFFQIIEFPYFQKTNEN